MHEIFLQIANMSISASYLILVILLIRMIFKSMPKSYRMILWYLVGIRLICPFTVESILSLLPTKEVLHINQVPIESYFTTSNIVIDTGSQQIDKTVTEVITNVIDTMAVKETTMLDASHIISIVWFIGFILLASYMLFTTLRLKLKLKESIYYKDNIYMCDHIHSYFVLGLFKPKIYCPSSINESDMNYILVHEQTHIKNKDNLVKPFAFLLLSIYWFNPMIWIAYTVFCKDIELACDEYVLNKIGIESKKEYSNILIQYSDSTYLGISPLTFSENNVSQRVKSILNYKKPTTVLKHISILLCVVLGLCFLTNPTNRIKTKLIKYYENDHEIETKIDDIEGWDIEIEDVQKITIHNRKLHDDEAKDVVLTKEDANKLILAFNSIKNKDIFEEYHEPLFGLVNSWAINVETSSGIQTITYDPTGILNTNNVSYHLQYQNELYEVIHQLNKKYDLNVSYYYKWFESDFKEGYAVATDTQVILNPSVEINETRKIMKYENLTGHNISFNELLDRYQGEIELGDIVETKDMRIKVIETYDDKITAVAVEFFGEKIEEKPKDYIQGSQWNEHEYSAFIPKPDSKNIVTEKNEYNEMIISVNNVSQRKYYKYIKETEKYGFEEKTAHEKNTYFAKNQDGYRMTVYYDEETQVMKVKVQEIMYSQGISINLNNKSKYDVYTVYYEFYNEYDQLEHDGRVTWHEGGNGVYIGISSAKGKYTGRLYLENDEDNYKEITFNVPDIKELIIDIDCYDDYFKIVNIERIGR